MNDDQLDSPKVIRTFLEGAGKCDLSVPKAERYLFLAEILTRVGYFGLKKKDKSDVRFYMQQVSGYSRAQLTRLISLHKKGKLTKVKARHTNIFATRYNRKDILLLAETDEAHQMLSGGATKKLFERALSVYLDNRYERLANISVSHIYNLRKDTAYINQRRQFSKTKSSAVKIGKRKKPAPNGKPGFIRVDTVHQGDQDKQKGVYHINAVDEVTQFEIIVATEKISENCLIPALEAIVETFPFKIINFHSDCGSEYINHTVVKLLNKLHIELTKSRARHCNDNALAECKNGAIVRKYLGYFYIAQKWAPEINVFYQQHLVPYLNFHRPCYFPEIITDSKGKERKKYPYKNMMTPLDKLFSLPDFNQYLKSNITESKLREKAMTMSDLDAAKALRLAQNKLFKVVLDTK